MNYKSFLDKKFILLIFKLTGRLLLILSLIYLTYHLYKNVHQIKNLTFNKELIILITVSSLIFMIAQWSIAIGWGKILACLQQTKIKWRVLLNIYGRANIAKYLPTNVMHFAGRQMYGREVGWAHSNMATATIIETALLVSIGILIVITLVFQRNILIETIELIVPIRIFQDLSAFHLTIVLASLFSLYLIIQKFIFSRLNYISISVIIQSLIFFILFFILSGAAFSLIASQLLIMDNFDSILLLLLAYGSAWVFGYIIPGAPGGIGIREFILTILLQNIGDKPTILAIVLLTRVSTTLGDIWLYLASLTIIRISSSNNASK